MADVTADINQSRAMRIAQRRVEGFAQQFGEAHRNLARHAAFPLVLTPDLLYQIWANFVPQAPWVAVAHVLLSRLCRQVGYEMYEMDIADRNLLLRELKEEFGQQRFDELGEFLLDYVAQRLTDDDADTQDLREAQEWTALAYTKPNEAARELAQRLSERVKRDDIGEVLRLASLVETLAEPLVEGGFEPLLTYTIGIKNLVSGNHKDAVVQLGELFGKASSVNIAGINVSIPPQLHLSSHSKALIEKEQGNEINFEDIDVLVQEIRTKIHPLIELQCSMMRVLDMTKPIELTREEGIYTNVNILEKVTGRKKITISELMQNSEQNDFDRFGVSSIIERRVPGLEAVERYKKLMVLGKPGSGKTTFLKYLAMQCIDGKFKADRVPLFINLKELAENSKKTNILKFVTQQFSRCSVTDATVKAKHLLQQGRALILLDGLDEIQQEDTKRIIQDIQDCSNQFDGNQFVITCRLAAAYNFDNFTDVEIADFTHQEIAIFANKWFQSKDILKAEIFIQELNQNKPIQELASSPLLLTLLCLVFEEMGCFPRNISELYKEGLDILLKKWDTKRNIARDVVYENLSLKRKEELLDQIALTTFEKGKYFFKQTELENYISEYIKLLPNSNSELTTDDSKIILKSIEAQHGLLVERARGIYSFSHLTLHEYFAARAIVIQGDRLDTLVSHITEQRWKQVFLLVAQMLQNADEMLFLMKHKIDYLIADDKKIQQFLIWLNNKSNSIDIPFKVSAIRAEYFAISADPEQQVGDKLFLWQNIHNVSSDIDSRFGFDKFITIDYALTTALNFNVNMSQSKALYRAIASALDNILDPNFKQVLLSLKNQLPNRQKENFGNWWQVNGKNWIKELRKIMIKYRNMGHDWQFSHQQQEKLKKYYYANQLLVTCLNSDCYVSRDVHQKIEDSLFLPITEIEQFNK